MGTTGTGGRESSNVEDADRRDDATRPKDLGVRDSGTMNNRSSYSSRSSKKIAGVEPFSARSNKK